MNKLHLTAWLTVLALLIAFALFWRHEGAQAARDQRTEDSLSAANAKLGSAVARMLQRHIADSLTEARRVANLTGQAVRVVAVNGQLEALTHVLRDSASGREKALIDSLTALYAQREALQQARVDTAMALLRGAAAARDTALALLRAMQAENTGLQVALVAARRKPLWDTPAVKVVQLALALKGVASLVGH